MDADEFKGWLEFMKFNDAEATRALGVGSRNTVAKFKAEGAPRYIGLACAALALNARPWTYRIEGTEEMSEEDQLIEQAVRQQGSSDYNTPSGATLDQLTEFIQAGRFRAFSRLYRRFQTVHPGNAAYLEAQIMPKVRNALILRKESFKALQTYEKENPEFTTKTFEALQSPESFETHMKAVEEQLDRICTERRSSTD